MITTINISLPKEMYKDVKKFIKKKRYSSVSELMRDALRKELYEEDKNAITENGFPVWFEDRALKAEKEPEENDTVLETEEDIHNYFLNLKKTRARGK